MTKLFFCCQNIGEPAGPKRTAGSPQEKPRWESMGRARWECHEPKGFHSAEKMGFFMQQWGDDSQAGRQGCVLLANPPPWDTLGTLVASWTSARAGNKGPLWGCGTGLAACVIPNGSASSGPLPRHCHPTGDIREIQEFGDNLMPSCPGLSLM